MKGSMSKRGVDPDYPCFSFIAIAVPLRDRIDPAPYFFEPAFLSGSTSGAIAVEHAALALIIPLQA